MVHLIHHVLKPASDSPTLDHFHRNRWTNSPEYAGAALAAAIHLLAVSGFPASERGWADTKNPASPASARVGSSSYSTEGGHHRYGHHRAHRVRQADGGTQKLQPEKPGEEELPTDPDVSGRDAGIHLG